MITSAPFNVLDYGADNTGATFSTLAIQAAINAAELVGGTVYFPVGIYKVTTLTITNGITLKGESNMWGWNPNVGSGLTFANLPTNVTVIYGTSTTAPVFDLNVTNFGGTVAGLFIEGFSFYQTQASYTAPTVYPYVIDDVNSTSNFWAGLTITQCCFLNVYQGIRLQHATKYNLNYIAGDFLYQGINCVNSTDACKIDRIHIWPFATAAINSFEQSSSSNYAIILSGQDVAEVSNVFMYGRAYGIKLISFWGTLSQMSFDTVGSSIYVNGVRAAGLTVSSVDIFGNSNVSGINGAIEVTGSSSISASCQFTEIEYINAALGTYPPNNVFYINDANINVIIDALVAKSLNTSVYINSAGTVNIDNVTAANYCQDPAAFQCNGALIQNESTTAIVKVGSVISGLNDSGSPSAVSYFDGYIDKVSFTVNNSSLLPTYPNLVYSSGVSITYTDSLGLKNNICQEISGGGTLGDYTGLRITPSGSTYIEAGTYMFGVTYRVSTDIIHVANDTRFLDVPITSGDVDQFITFNNNNLATTTAKRQYIRSLSYTGGLLTNPTSYGRLFQGVLNIYNIFLCKSTSVCNGFQATQTQYAAAPTVGIYRVGEIVNNSTPVVGQPKSWQCTVAGTPGTWVSTGNL